MKFFSDGKTVRTMEGGISMIHEHRGSGRHIPPHERKGVMHIEFGEADWVLLKEVFGDEDTALAASEIIREAPPEIQILAIQLMNIMEEAV